MHQMPGGDRAAKGVMPAPEVGSMRAWGRSGAPCLSSLHPCSVLDIITHHQTRLESAQTSRVPT